MNAGTTFISPNFCLHPFAVSCIFVSSFFPINFSSCGDDWDARASASLPCNSKQRTRWLLALKVVRSTVIEILTCSQTSSFCDTFSHHNFCSCGDDSDVRASASLPCNSKQHTRWLLALKVVRSKVIEILTCTQSSSVRDICHIIFIVTGSELRSPNCTSAFTAVPVDSMYWG